MAYYALEELKGVLEEMGCGFESSGIGAEEIWSKPDRTIFTLPVTHGDFTDAALVDIVLADQWLPKPYGKPKRHNTLPSP